MLKFINNKIKFILNKEKNILIIYSNNSYFVHNLKFKLFFNPKNNSIYFTKIPIYMYSYITDDQILSSIRKIDYSFLMKNINQLLYINYKKIKLVGIGYKVSIIKKNKVTLLDLKLGHSHLIYIKIPSNLKVFCPEPSVIFITGNSIDNINKLAWLIKSFRIPDVYKGKGVLYEYENISFKEGKKS